MSLTKFFKDMFISLAFTLMVIILGIFLIIIFPLTPLQKALVFLILLTGYLIVEIKFYNSLMIRKHIQRKNQNFKRSLLNQISPVHEEVYEKDYEREIEESEDKNKIQQKSQTIQKPKYVGSTETRKYHLFTCRFSKLIKGKYRIESDDESFFKKKKFKPCKTCIKTKKGGSKLKL